MKRLGAIFAILLLPAITLSDTIYWKNGKRWEGVNVQGITVLTTETLCYVIDPPTAVGPSWYGGFERIVIDRLPQRKANLTPTPIPVPTKFDSIAAQTIDRRTWQTLVQYSGYSDKRTEPFRVGPYWRIEWQAISAETNMPRGLFVNACELHSGKIRSVVSTDRAGSDITYMYEGGVYYFHIGAVNCFWRITVKEFLGDR